MPQLTDRNQIRRILESDRDWSAYALADLDPGYFEYCSWFNPSPNVAAVALLYQAFSTPVMVAVGAAESLAGVLAEVETALGSQTSMYLSVRPDMLRLLSESYDISDVRPMLRMKLNRSRAAAGQVHSNPAWFLGTDDLDAVQELFADGEAAGEVPAFFVPTMLGSGLYWGIREANQLVAVAGTHLLSKTEGIAAIGNVYTRRDRRSRGYGSFVTSAVVAELRAMSIPTVILNVHSKNLPARRVYERLGFDIHCDYYEAVATRRNPNLRSQNE